MEVSVKDDKKPADKKSGGPPSKKPGGPPGQGGPPPGAQHNLHHPPVGVPKAGQGLNPMSAMMGGIGPDIMSQMGPPPPPSPGAPMGPNGLPVGGNLSSSDPMMDPAMNGSSLFQGLNMQLDPMAGGAGLDDPMGGGSQPGAEQLLQLLALLQAGVGPGGMAGGGGPMGGGLGRLNPSGVMNDPTHPGETMGLNPFGVTQ
jgi:hypothetical protein